MGSNRCHGLQGGLCLCQRGHRLHNKEVNTSRSQSHGLHLIRLNHGVGVTILFGQAKRSKRACHKSVVCVFFAHAFHGCPGKGNGSRIDLLDLVLQAKALEPYRICAKGIGLDQLRARHEVLLMQFAHELGL